MTGLLGRQQVRVEDPRGLARRLFLGLLPPVVRALRVRSRRGCLVIYVEFIGWTVYWIGMLLLMAGSLWPKESKR